MKKVLVIENWEDRGEDIVRLIVASGHSATMVRPYVGEEFPPVDEFDAAVLSGGPMSVNDRGHSDYAFLVAVMKYIEALVDHSVPCLGICLGHQLLAAVLGGRVVTMVTPDVGIQSIRTLGNGAPHRSGSFLSFVFHRDHVVALPGECVPTFTSAGCAIEGFRHETRPIQGVQFHPEVPSAAAVEVLTRWRSEPDGHRVVGDPVSFDSRGAQVVFDNLLADLLTYGGVA